MWCELFDQKNSQWFDEGANSGPFRSEVQRRNHSTTVPHKRLRNNALLPIIVYHTSTKDFLSQLSKFIHESKP